MDPVHLHLMLAHIPVILVPLSLVLLIWGYRTNNDSILKAGASIALVAGLFCVPVFLLGENAEERVEHLQGVSESVIEAHEDSATIALWFTVTLGIGSAILLTLRKNENLTKRVLPVIMLLGLITSGALGYAANRGGMIRHTEIGGSLPTDKISSENYEEDDDD